MPRLTRTLPLLIALALSLPVAAVAQSDGESQATPKGGADPALAKRLQDNEWTLHAGRDAAGQPIAGLLVPGKPGKRFVLRFDAANVSVTGGCNAMTGSWQLGPQARLTVGRLASTMKACEPALMQADEALAAVLAQPLHVQLDPGATPALRLVTPGGQTLALAGEATLASRYGAPTRIFLEVAAQTVPCQPGAGAATQCLRVRERRFDDQGLRVDPPGEWHTFHDRIDGYTHTPGVRNVLRVDRYERAQAPADASAYLYVLDLVVESATESAGD